MRDIIFRGKSTKTGEWIKGYYIHFQDNLRNREAHRISDGYADSMPEGDGYDFCAGFEDINPETLGQFTGVYDNKGVPIYEGDIVRYRWTDERYKRNQKFYIGEVEWNEWEAGWGLKHCMNVSFRSARLEVVGNIHDNPDYPELRKRF